MNEIEKIINDVINECLLTDFIIKKSLNSIQNLFEKKKLETKIIQTREKEWNEMKKYFSDLNLND